MPDLHVIIGRSGTRFTLIEDVEFPEEGITVPAGYRCDFASVPRFLWWWLPPLGYYSAAALLHDYLYDQHNLNAAPLFAVSEDRRDADLAFLRQMRRDGVGWRTRWTMYLAVRLFGGRHWRTP